MSLYSEGCEQATLLCPTTTECNSCIINCEQKEACKDTTIYGYSCQNVQLNCDAGTHNDAFKNAYIYAPDSFGNLTMNMFSGDKCFSGVDIYAPYGSGFIQMNCNSTITDDNWYEIILFDVIFVCLCWFLKLVCLKISGLHICVFLCIAKMCL